MIHPFRMFGISRVESTEELARILSENDSQKYATIYNGYQIESIISGWCTKEKSEEHIHNLLAGNFVKIGPVWPITEPAEGHICPLCR